MDDKLIDEWIRREETKDSLISYIETLKKIIIKMEKEMKDIKDVLKKNNIK